MTHSTSAAQAATPLPHDGCEDRRLRGTPSPVLAEVIRALPVGVELHDGRGATVLRNPAADALSSDASLARRTVTGTVMADGGPYRLTTTFAPEAKGVCDDDLFRKAYFDDLTGLPNRSHLQHAVATLMEGGGDGFALAFVDLDGFKRINDYYGHAVGDEILIKIARRLSARLAPGSLLARIGGDEFVLLLRRPADIVAEVTELASGLQAPFFADGHEIFASASIGVSLCPEHGVDFDTLRRSADIAMYRVKRDRKGAVAVFDDAMRTVADGRMETEQRLRLAIRDRRFLCAYQPKVDIHTRQTVGLEVLLRWRDEAGTIQPPGDFIALAIELGVINDICRMVLQESVEALDDLDAAFGAGTTVSFNVAARQAGDPAFMADLVADLSATGHAERFMVELTEEAFFAKGPLQDTILPALRRIGTKVSIDDFGVGYSSLATLADLDADELKIDRSFITDIDRRPRSQVILKAIESLGHALGMTIVAEGLETFGELAYLAGATRIRQAQGFFFARPMTLDEFASGRTFMLPSRAAAPTRGLVATRSAGGRNR